VKIIYDNLKQYNEERDYV